MKTNVAKIEKNKVEVEVELEAEKFAESIDKAYRKLVKQVNIPGFRKGRVPKQVLTSYIGKESLYSEAIEQVVPQAYYEAVKETQIEPVDQPELDIVQAEENKPLIFKAKVVVKPEVELGEYKGVTVEHKEEEITSEDVDNYLKSMQERHARLITVENRAVENGDTAVIDFEGSIDGEPFPGGKGENYSLEIGSRSFIPGFEEQIVGMQKGEEKEIQVTFPEEYHQENLAGKDATFKVKVNEIKTKEILPLDDEFAKDVSEFETLEELREDIEKKLKERAKQESARVLKNKVLEKVKENCEVEIPDVMVERRVDALIQDMEQRMLTQGITLEKYLEITNHTLEDLRKEYRDNARESIKADLVLEAICKKEGIEVSDEELEKEIEKMAEAYNQEKDKLKTMLQMQGNLESLRESLAIERTLDLLVKESNVVEPKKDDGQEGEEKGESVS
ncbi:MAG: trigger factor [Clostridia bacterium]|jgi:trigger factor|nr:trigger factor [Clostridiales bacterium]MDK2984538.1 trigger factor [Clostridia bacterium]